jgi:hypothetical protein
LPKSAPTFRSRPGLRMPQLCDLWCGKNTTSRRAPQRPSATSHPRLPAPLTIDLCPVRPTSVCSNPTVIRSGRSLPPCTRRMPAEYSHMTQGTTILLEKLPFRNHARPCKNVSLASYRPAAGIATIGNRRTCSLRKFCRGLNAIGGQSGTGASAFMMNEVVYRLVCRARVAAGGRALLGQCPALELGSRPALFCGGYLLCPFGPCAGSC